MEIIEKSMFFFFLRQAKQQKQQPTEAYHGRNSRNHPTKKKIITQGPTPRLQAWALGLARALAPWPGPGPHNCCKWGAWALALGHLKP